jgi:hypothetical protein
MRKVGSKGAPSAADFKESAKTAKKPKKSKWWLRIKLIISPTAKCIRVKHTSQGRL